MLPLRARVDLGTMAMKGYSAFPKAPALLEPHHQIVECHIQDTAEVQSVYSTAPAPADWANIYMCVPIYIYIYIYKCVYIYICVCMCIYIYIHICVCVFVYMYTYVCVYVCIYICVCMCVYIYIYIYAHPPHIHKYIYMQKVLGIHTTMDNI